MIVVTRLNDSQFAINPDLIERIHENPDTTLVMVDGAKFIVTESLAEVIEQIAAYRAHVINLAYSAGNNSAGNNNAGHGSAGINSPGQTSTGVRSAGEPDPRPDAVVPLRPRRM